MKVVLCDRQKMFIEALASVLTSRGFEVCPLALTPRDALAVIRAERPDVALVDAGLVEDGRFLGSLASEGPTRIVLLLEHAEDAATVGFRVDAGLSGMTARTEEIDRIVAAVDRVGRGESVAIARSADPPPGAARSAGESDLIERVLTAREREVLDRLAHGQGTVVIADQMGISVNTARTHIQNAMNKLGAHSRLEAVAVAVRAGRIDGHVTRLPGE